MAFLEDWLAARFLELGEHARMEAYSSTPVEARSKENCLWVGAWEITQLLVPCYLPHVLFDPNILHVQYRHRRNLSCQEGDQTDGSHIAMPSAALLYAVLSVVFPQIV
jgi:hypothetical protein